MADIVRNVNGIENQVQSVVAGIKEIVNTRPKISFRRIVSTVFGFFSPVSASVAYSQEFALLPSDKRIIRE